MLLVFEKKSLKFGFEKREDKMLFKLTAFHGDFWDGITTF